MPPRLSLLKAKHWLERSTGISLLRSIHHGHRDCSDIQRTGLHVTTIYDVGANVGNAALKFAAAFPSATIHCFEPCGSTFAQLSTNTAAVPAVQRHQLGLSSSSGQHTLYLSDKPAANSLLPDGQNRGTETVQVSTVDEFSARHQVDRIDLLKIDTEGSDLEVLRGAKKLLERNGICMVLAEVGFSRSDPHHVYLEELADFLRGHDFHLYGIYDQVPADDQFQMRYANACFCNQRAMTKSPR